MNESDKKIVEGYLEVRTKTVRIKNKIKKANKWDVDGAYKTYKAEREEDLMAKLKKKESVDDLPALNKEKRYFRIIFLGEYILS